MPEFSDKRTQLNTAKTDRQQTEQNVLLSNEKLKKLSREKDRLLRTLSPDDTEIQKLLAEEKALKTRNYF